MSNVPKLRFKEFSDEWKETTIGAILKIGSGKDYKHLSNGDVPVYGTGGYMLSVNDFLYDGESVCIGRKGTIDKPIFLNGKFWTVDTLFYTHSYNNCKPKFIYLIFLKINWKLYNEASGVPSLSKSTIERIKFNLPQKEEQEKIASFLSQVDSKIEQLTKKEELLEQYKKGIMQKIFSQEIRFKDDDGSDFPEWEEKRLGNLGNIITGKTPSTANDALWEGDIEFITPTDIKDKKYQEKTVRNVTKQKNMQVLPIGTIIYTCIASIGKLSLTTLPSITNQQINSLLVNEKYNNEFIYYCLVEITPYIKSTQANTTLPIINKTEFSKFKLKIPCLKEQTKIANFLSAIDNKIEANKKQLDKTKEFKKALLQQMFI